MYIYNMKLYSLLIILIYLCRVKGQLQVLNSAEINLETLRINMIVDMVTMNLKENGWTTILCFGNFPDELYINLQNTSYPFTLSSLDREDKYIDDVVRYDANTILMNVLEIGSYENTLLKVRQSPYWHPHANIILYLHEKDQNVLAKIFFSMWYYKAVNVVVVQYDNTREVLLVSYYTPYVSDDYKLNHLRGCWTTRKIGMPVSGFDEGLKCEQNCHSVSLTSKLRADNLGTCIGFNTITVPYNDTTTLTTLNLFEEKGKNLHGFIFRALGAETIPFFLITDNGNGSYVLGGRDGFLWNEITKLMNFSLYLVASYSEMKAVDFEKQIGQLFSFAFRKADFYLCPIYLFDVAVVEIDNTFPYKDSGVCIVSHRAGFDTTLFDVNTLHANLGSIIQSVLCFVGVWAIFTIYKIVEKGKFTYDQFGKDLLNAFRNVLLITLCNPPSRSSFRIFLTISIWSYFILNFVTQASIISFLTAAKRGKEVETFEDMIEKGYYIYGMSSPDLILPDTEEKFRIINSKLVPIKKVLECANQLAFDSRRFCLIDCSIGRHLARNHLNKDGEQYLHIAKDRMHSHYLNMLLMKHSPLTEYFNKYMITFYEAGLIKKWEQYRYTAIKEEPPTKPLRIDDLKNLFNMFCLSLGMLFLVFLLELITFHGKNFFKNLTNKNRNRRI